MAPYPSAVGGTALSRATAKLKRARDNLEQFTQKEKDIDKQLQLLQERTYWLTTLRRLNGGQFNDWMSSVNDRSIIPFCKAWNLQLAEEMQARLPAEMRNLVYHYLWDTDTLNAYPDVSRVAGGAKCLDDHCRCDWSHDNSVLPHFVKTEYMGRNTTQEIIRALYEAFHFRNRPLTVRLPEHIKSAVSQDMFRVGIDPGLHLRSLVIRIKLDRLRIEKPPPHVLTDACRHIKEEKTYTKGEELQSWLKALLYIKCKAKFELRIELLQRNVRLSVIEEVLRVLAEARKIMQDRQAEVKVEWICRGHWIQGKNTDWPGDFLSIFVDDFYYLPQKTWRTNVMHFLIMAEVDEEILEQHVRFFNEPCRHMSDRDFVHAMWDDSEDDCTTDGEEEDQEPVEQSDEDEEESDDSDDDEGEEEEDDVGKVPRTLLTYENMYDTQEASDDPDARN